MAASLLRNRDLILQLTKRDVVGRYKGSVLGVFWSFLNPIILLVVYTFVFSVVFKAKWGGVDEDRAQFAVVLFAGMIIHSLFSEVLLRAPTLIVSNASYVSKILFPIEILPVITMGTAFFHALVSILVLAVAIMVISGSLPLTIVWVPLILMPLILMALGFAWGIASLGVFLRDVAQPIGLLMTVLLFASPVFYPISALPEGIQPWLLLNPLTFIIEQMRAVMIYGRVPNFGTWSLYSVVSIFVAWGGYAWFQKTRKGFANVL
ncbi:ABC transporter permease [Neorhizobium sp. BT27B]|uniref:ABC transporter permease n=1 Tax=Neorhizobium sp. BT27B TaxID=3142625 RepID=UPI003D2BC6FE